MKTLTRVIAVLVLAAMLASVMAACSSYWDERIYGSWKQTDKVDGNWTWTFEKGGKCSLTSDDGFTSSGTYKLEGEGTGKIKITLDSWPLDNKAGEKLFSYAVTETVMDLLEENYDFHCFKQ